MSVKVAFLGDLHLQRSIYGYDMTEHIRSVMYSFFRFCREHKVYAAVQLGDVFDGPRPTLAMEKLFIQWCNEFERARIPLHIIAGNHEVVSKGGIASALSPAKAIDYQHVHIHEQPHVLTTRTATSLLFLPFPSPSLYDGMPGWLEELQALRRRDSSPQYLVCSHLNVEGAKVGEQEWVYRGGDYCIPADLVLDDRTALVVSGHIHKHQWVGKQHLIVGAAQRLRFNEASNPIIFALVDLDEVEGKTGVELFEDDQALCMSHWECDASAWGNGGTAPSLDEVMENRPEVEGALVKVQPFVDEQSAVDWGELEKQLYQHGAAFVTVLSPIFVKRKVKQATKKHRIGEPLKAASFFIKSRIKEPTERKAIARTFRKVQKEADSDS